MHACICACVFRVICTWVQCPKIPLELELQVVLTPLTWMLKTKFASSVQAVCTLTLWDLSVASSVSSWINCSRGFKIYPLQLYLVWLLRFVSCFFACLLLSICVQRTSVLSTVFPKLHLSMADLVLKTEPVLYLILTLPGRNRINCCLLILPTRPLLPSLCLFICIFPAELAVQFTYPFVFLFGDIDMHIHLSISSCAVDGYHMALYRVSHPAVFFSFSLISSKLTIALTAF